jgi:hypothetical protein
VPYGREGEGLHLSPVPEALNRSCPEITYPAELYRPSPLPHDGLSELSYAFHHRTIAVTQRTCINKGSSPLAKTLIGTLGVTLRITVDNRDYHHL